MRDPAFTVMIGVLKLRETVIVGWAIHPHIVNPEFAVRFKIIKNDHLAGAHKRDLPDLPRFQPAALDGGESAARKAE